MPSFYHPFPAKCLFLYVYNTCSHAVRAFPFYHIAFPDARNSVFDCAERALSSGGRAFSGMPKSLSCKTGQDILYVGMVFYADCQTFMPYVRNTGLFRSGYFSVQKKDIPCGLTGMSLHYSYAVFA